MCEPPRASVVERGAVLWWVAGFLTYLCPLNIRPLPRGWSEHRRASVRSARGVPRVCIEGNSHSEAEVSNRHGRAQNERTSSHAGCSPRARAPARFCLFPEEETNAKQTGHDSRCGLRRHNKSKSTKREGITHEHAPTSPTP